MDEQECIVAYQELAEILNELGVQWLLKRVNETIKRGKTLVVREKGKPPSRLKTEPYTYREQLMLLIDAMEQAFVAPAAMEVEISEFLKSQNLAPQIIRSDGNEETIRDYRSEVVFHHKENADALKELLEELRQDALAHVD